MATSPYYSVADYGVVGDGTTDDSHAIRLAITDAAPKGGIVFFPSGRYFVRSSLTVPSGLTLEGAGWNTPGSETNVFTGSWILVEADAGFSPVTVLGSSGAVRNLAFNVTNQSKTGPPANVQPMIIVTGANVLIEDVFLYNPYDGIYVYGTGRAVIRRIFGQPLRYGVKIDYSQDTNYIEGIHFWPYWQGSSTDAGKYQREYGTAISLFRCDNPHISNIFASNYNTGLSMATSSTGIPHKVHLANADFDDCVTGIHVACASTKPDSLSIQMANVTMQAPEGAPATSYGVWVEAGPASTVIQASNLRLTGCGASAVRIEANNVLFFGENVFLEDWGKANPASEGFSIAPGCAASIAYLGLGFYYTGTGRPYSPGPQFRRVEVAP